MQAPNVGFATLVAASLFSAGACGGTPVRVNRASTCVPAGTDIVPSRMALVGTRFTFCLAEHAGNSYCFTADLEAKTIAPASAPPDASSDHRQRVFWEGNGENPTGASLAPSLRGKGLTACTHDKATCHELPIDAASAGDKPVAVSDDATLVAIDTRDPSPDGKGWLEIWDAVAGKQLASFEIRYGPTTAGYETPHRKLVFLGHTVVAFTESACALPCSSATMYSTRGKYLGMLATDPTAATAEHFHDELYLLRTQGPDRSFVVQDAAREEHADGSRHERELGRGRDARSDRACRWRCTAIAPGRNMGAEIAASDGDGGTRVPCRAARLRQSVAGVHRDGTRRHSVEPRQESRA